VKLSRRKKQKILPKLAVIDGFSNSGKSLVAPILGYLEGGENWVIDYKYEQIAVAEYLRKIDKNSAMAIVENWLDSDIYDILISRKVNSFTVIFRSCTNVNMLTQNKTRLFFLLPLMHCQQN